MTTSGTLRVLLVDDEAPARARLVRLLAAQPGVMVVGEASDGVRALEAARALAPDVVLLDIQMPELDGLAVAAALGAWAEDAPSIVFVTAHDVHAVRAFELAAVDYLLKPVARERLARALDRARERRRAGDARGAATSAVSALRRAGVPMERMAVRVGSRFVVFATARIRAIRAQDHYAALLVDDRELLADDSLDELELVLDPSLFVRIHRSALVNVTRILALEHEGDRKYVAVLDDGTTRLPVARERLDDVKARLGVR